MVVAYALEDPLLSITNFPKSGGRKHPVSQRVGCRLQRMEGLGS
jgi:hypothetical protein